MRNIETMFSSDSEEWETPEELFNELNLMFDFELDVCASDANHKCQNYFTKETDGLSQSWKCRNWMNPPYGREIEKWVRKANFESTEFGVLTVALLPARTDTKWYHLHCKKWHKQFLKGRLKFRLPCAGGGWGTRQAPLRSRP